MTQESTHGDAKVLRLMPLCVTVIGLVLESIAGFYQQEVRKEFSPTSFQFMFFNSSYLLAISLFTCRPA